MKHKISYFTAACLILITVGLSVAGTLVVLFLNDRLVSPSSDAWYTKVKAIDELVDENYYGNADNDALADSVAYGYLSGIGDRYAVYYDAEAAAENESNNRGNRIGIGASVMGSSNQNSLIVYRLDPNGTACSSGVMVGDMIIAADGVSVEEDGFDAVYDAILGEENTDCELDIIRGEECLKISVTRKKFEITTVYYNLIGDAGYMMIERFNDLTDDQMIAAIEEMKSQGAKGLIFDLRGCPGGLLDPTADILDYLLPEGVIVSAEYADGENRVLHSSDASELDMPMTVLISNETASAGELFAAAIRDYDKGVLIGTTTYGKGVMQHSYNFDDGSSVKFTVAQFCPPCGEGFDGEGVAPDIEVELSDEQKENFNFLPQSEDPHILAAVEYLNSQG